MEIEIDNGLRLQLINEYHVASVIESPKVSGIISIPQKVQSEGQDYKIISIQKFAFINNQIESLTFSEDSEVQTFETCSFNCTSIKKLQIPPKLRIIEDGWSLGVSDLTEINVSPKNNLFKYVDNKYLVGKSQKESEIFDVLHFARCDIDEAFIPSQIKIIKEYSFYNYSRLKSVTFPKNSQIKVIEENAFSCTPIESIQFLSEKVEIGTHFFSSCFSLKTILFPKAVEINFIDTESMEDIPKDTEIKVKKGVKLFGPGLEKCKTQIKEFEDDFEDDNSKNIKNKRDEIEILMNHIRSLENRLSKYEKVEPFELSSISVNDFDSDNENDENENQVFIDDEEESNFQIIEKVGEGATSVIYKVIDNRTSSIMCKKVLKTNEKQVSFEDVKNIVKEFEVLHKMNHPSICKSIGINTQEKVSSTNNDMEDDDDTDTDNDNDDDFDDHDSIKSSQITTVALFIEYFPYSLKECIEKNILNNTLKAKIAVEVAFGMSYIHSLGMIHRDLKIENIMLNCIFEVKIIDFGLVHVNDLMNSNDSLTRGVGTLYYMSPEMANEEEYDQKTDVYSFGIVLFMLFTGHLPKQNLKDKLNNNPFVFPRPSFVISQYCIDLIKKCISYEPINPPTFTEILNDMKNHSFSLASEINSKIISQRYSTLNK